MVRAGEGRRGPLRRSVRDLRVRRTSRPGDDPEALSVPADWIEGLAVDPMDPTLAYVGTYTGAKSQGIYLFRLEADNPEISQNIRLVPLGLAAASPNPSFIERDLKRTPLYST